jgi:hypothetical protein
MPAPADKRRHIEAVEKFVRALGDLLALSTLENRSYSGGGTVVPRPGHESVWRQRRAAVDRSAPAAARAFMEAGVWIDWKPPGTWSTQPVNPAAGWGTILEDFPRFGVDVLEAVCNQALGSLESEAYLLPDKRPRRHRGAFFRGHLAALLVASVGTLVGGIAVAYLAFRLGWVGN